MASPFASPCRSAPLTLWCLLLLVVEITKEPATAFTCSPLNDVAHCRQMNVGSSHLPSQLQLPFLLVRPRTSTLIALRLPASASIVDSASTLVLFRFVAPTISSLITYFTLVASFDRPQGALSVPSSNLCAKQSQVKGAGFGLYSAVSLPEGTTLGTYPGVVRASSAYLGKYGRYPQCGSYAWRFSDNAYYIDPTDAQGNIGDLCYGGSELVPGSLFIHEQVMNGGAVSTLLARINEPPIGGPGCNVFAREDLNTRKVTFSTSRDVVAGEELFMDYGLTYDRTGYGGSDR